MPIGFRPAAGSNVAWLLRGTRLRSALHSSWRVAVGTQGRGVQTSPTGALAAHTDSASVIVMARAPASEPFDSPAERETDRAELIRRRWTPLPSPPLDRSR